MNDKTKAFVKIIEMTSNSISNVNLQSFSNLEQFVTEHELRVEDDLINNIKHRCKMINTKFDEYFKENFSEFRWIRETHSFQIWTTFPDH